MKKECSQEKVSFGLYEVLSFPWQPIIQTGFRHTRHSKLIISQPTLNID